MYHDGDRAAGFELSARFDHGVYQDLVRDGAFELAPENHGANLGGKLAPDQPVDVTLFLRHDLLPAWFSAVSAFGAEANHILSAMASLDHPLCQSDAWVFVSVMQDAPGQAFQVGFKHTAYEGLDAHLLL